jgi:hypothetical protein
MRILGTVLIAALACLTLATCASIGPPLPPSLELPKAPIDLHAARKGNKVALTWTVPTLTTDRRRVRYLGKTEVCRGLEPVLKECGKPAGEVPAPANFRVTEKPPAKKLTASFIDTLPEAIQQEHPTGFATYAVEVLNSAARGAGLSNEVHVPLLPTLPPFGDFAANVTAQGVLLSWQCPENSGAKRTGVRYSFQIYRRPVSGGAGTKTGEMDATECATGTRPGASREDSFLDKTFEWEKSYIYRAAVMSVLAVPGKPPVEVEGDDTPEVKVFANDVFPPAVPTGLQAVSSGPGQQPFIDLIWTPDTDADLAGYNVYRREDGGAMRKLNLELVKVPAFRDTQAAAGQTYSYSVSAVDAHGNESARSDEANETMP